MIVVMWLECHVLKDGMCRDLQLLHTIPDFIISHPPQKLMNYSKCCLLESDSRTHYFSLLTKLGRQHFYWHFYHRLQVVFKGAEWGREKHKARPCKTIYFIFWPPAVLLCFTLKIYLLFFSSHKLWRIRSTDSY